MTKSEKKDEKDSLTDNKIASKKSKLSEEKDTSTKEKTIEEKLIAAEEKLLRTLAEMELRFIYAITASWDMLKLFYMAHII